MGTNASVQFFDDQFRRQVAEGDLQLNPFEAAALKHVRGNVLEYGCGLGNLAVSAARQGCTVVALDGSHAAIEHLRQVTRQEGLGIFAAVADLRTYEIKQDFDTVVCIGLLMFFDCPTAHAKLAELREHVLPGGTLVVNVLIEGTTYMDMFSTEGHCLFKPEEVRDALGGWELLGYSQEAFTAPRGKVKLFATAVAQRPL